MEIIKAGEETLAVIVKKDDCQDGYNFITPHEWELQVGFNNYQAEAICTPHEHYPRDHKSTAAMEVIHFLYGLVEMSFYWKDELVEKRTLGGDDTVIILQGGHGIKMLEPTKIFEIKQGPYQSRDKDKRDIDVQL